MPATDARAAIDAIRRATEAQIHELPALDSRQLGQLEAYLLTLLLWRRHMALIATSDPLRIAEQHILDALHVAPYLPRKCRLADIGSGAGLPGIPLAIALPAARVTLIESRRRKASFLRAVRRSARLDNVDVAETRAETIGERFDVVVSRALGALDPFLKLAADLLYSGGTAIAMKGPAGGGPEPSGHAAFEGPRVVFYRLAQGRGRTLLIYTLRERGPESCFT